MSADMSLTPRASARERLLAAAESLFYEEGFSAVGIDRVIERAGVAKASLYYCFGSKEELICCYLRGRQVSRQARLTAALSRYAEPKDRLLGVFDYLAEQIAQPGYRGCAFVKAGAELHAGSGIKEACDESRRWMRQLFEDLARAAGLRDPAHLAVQLSMLYDGASIAVQMDANREAAASARAVASALLEGARDKNSRRGGNRGKSPHGSR
jgi:AcrR family transcriptional regulator